MKLSSFLVVSFLSFPILAQIENVTDDQIGLYKQKIVDAYISSSMLCIKEGGILKPNYVIPSEELFKINEVKKIVIDRSELSAQVTMTYESDDKALTINYVADMSSDLQRVWRFKIETSKKTWINLGSLLEPDLVPGPINTQQINCRSLK